MTGPATTRIDSLAEAGRYLSEIAAQDGFEQAMSRVEANASPDVAPAIARLRRQLAGEEHGVPTSDFSLLAALIRGTHGSGDVREGLTVVNDNLREARTLAATMRASMRTDIAYPVLLLTMATVVTLIWQGGIAPGFAGLYGDLGVPLPSFSRLIMERWWITFGLIGFAACATVVIQIGRSRLAGAVAALTPPEDRLAAIAAGRRIHSAIERWRRLTLARALVTLEVPVHDALVAASDTRSAADALAAEFRLATSLGIGEQELRHLHAEATSAAKAEIERRRTVVRAALSLGAAVVVAIITIAIYLPIFELGGVI